MGICHSLWHEVQRLGRLARRVLEEGRVRVLREAGFEAWVLRYYAEDVSPDNLAILARRRAGARPLRGHGREQ